MDHGEGESSLQNSGSPGRSRANVGIREQEWANELRRADERANEVRNKYDDLVQSHQQLGEKVKRMTDQIEVRDNEILRLGGLYQGGQNLDQLQMKYHQDLNEKTVQKLQNQIDFLNKENHRISVELEIYQQDKTVVYHLEQQKKEIDDLTFENSTLRKDLRELTTVLKDFQEREFQMKQLERARMDQETKMEGVLREKLQEVESEKNRATEERKRAEALRTAYEADK